MIGKIPLPKRSIVFNWLSSYLLILLIPVLITGVVYFQTNIAIEKEINKSNSFFLNKVRQHMDSTLHDVERVGLEIALDNRFQSLINLGPSIPDRSYFDIYQTAQNLKLFLIANNSVADFFIFILKPDLVIGAGTALNSRAYYEQYLQDLDLSFSDWREMINGRYKGEYLAMPFKNQTEKNNKALFYTYSLPITIQGEMTANLFIKVNTDKFFIDTSGVETVNNGTILILNERNQVLASSSPIDLGAAVRYEMMPLDTGVFYTKLNGVKVAVSYTASRQAEWRFLSIIPVRVFRENAVYIRNLMIAGLLLCLILGGFLSSYFVVQNYNPIRSIVGALEEMLKLTFDRRNNEYTFIQQAIHRTADEKAAISSQLDQQNQILRSVFLARLLKGQTGDVPVEELLSKYNICFLTDHFVVLAFFIEDIDPLDDKREISDPGIYFQMLKKTIADCIEEKIGGADWFYLVEVDQLLIGLINLSPAGLGDWRQRYTDYAGNVQRELFESQGIELTVAIGGDQQTVAGISAAYREALAVLEYKRVLDDERVLFYDQINRSPQGGYYYPLEIEHQLIQYIKAGEYQGAGEILTKVFAVNFEVNRLSLELARCLMFNLISTMIKTSNEISNTDQGKFFDGLNPVGGLLECQTINQMKSKIMEILSRVCAFIVENSKRYSYRVRDLVCSYIHENYQDPNLNITTIADHLEMNPEYISKAFKAQTGEGLLDYINNYRIEQAKDLMNENCCNLDEIASRVGYSNTRTFNRAFKKSQGITPGKYKDMQR